VVVNLYAFREAAAKPDATRGEVIEMIDVGGPTMVRAAAKNHGGPHGVGVVVDPEDYAEILAVLKEQGALSEALRRRLAGKAFRHTADYDRAIADWFATTEPQTADDFPAAHHLDLDRVMTPRYGENPHQKAAVYAVRGGSGVFGGFAQLQGKELSWNNLLDADAARRMVSLFEEPTVAIVKHNNPCGVGRGKTLALAYARAFATDPTSAFGSILAVNRTVDLELAEAMAKLFVEVLIAPAFTDEARARFEAKKDLRLIAAPRYVPGEEVELRAIDGGFLAQQADGVPDDPKTWTCATRRGPTEDESRALQMAWNVARYVKSNAIVLADADQTVGIGAGQMSRVDSCRLAISKAQRPVTGTAAASDAFFPFRDGLDVLATAGITALVQPGGSKRDDEIIAAADEHGLAMLMTGTRHFRH
jgi:phosphoribosylaminoimidazolecarboxamide formyltransferase / IMP cyclohydrolase